MSSSYLGKYYVKIGHSDEILKGSLELTDVRKWYCGSGDDELERELYTLVETVFNGKDIMQNND